MLNSKLTDKGYEVSISPNGSTRIPSVTLAELSTTLLARDNFPGFAYCSDPTVMDYVKSTGTQWKKGDGTVVSSDPALPGTSTNILRFSSPTNRTPNNKRVNSTSTVQRMVTRVPHYIGSGDQFELRPVLNNWCQWLGSTDLPGNTQTVYNTFMELPGVSTKRCTYDGGANGTILIDGQDDKVGDPITPAAFGLAKFTQGTLYYMRHEVEVPAGGTFMSVDTFDANSSGGHVFDPAVTQCTNIGGSGDLQYNGAVTFTSLLVVPLMIGKFVSGDPVTWFFVGDSITNGVGDTLSNGRGKGYAGRALAGSDWATSIAGCNASKPNGQAAAWSSRMAKLCKYANNHWEAFGPNNFDNTPNADPSTVGYVLDLSRAIWQSCKDSASTVPGATPQRTFRMKMLPRTDAPTGTTEASQSVYGGATGKWRYPNGNAVDFNSRLASEPLIYKVISFDSFTRSTTELDKWKYGTDNTIDGTHPGSNNGHIEMGATARSAIAA